MDRMQIITHILAFGAGMAVGAILAKVLDPPPEWLVDEIAKSEWAQSWASRFVPSNLPPEKRKEAINMIAKLAAKKLAKEIAS